MHFQSALKNSLPSIDLRLIRRSLKQAKQYISSEITSKLQAIHMNLPDLSQTKDYLETEHQSFRTDYRVMQRELNRMYWKNEFYMKTIDRTIDATIGVAAEVAMKVYTVTR